MLNFKNVIVKLPAKSMIDGITSTPESGKPNYELACTQHKFYIQTLKDCGVDVTTLDVEEKYPDSCFVEDTAVVIPGCCAIISNPGVDSRNGEIIKMKPVLEKFFPNYNKNYFQIKSPGTLDGGDVMMVEDTYYIGLSARTNQAGIDQFKSFASQFNKKTFSVEMDKGLHLKSGVNYLEMSPKTQRPVLLLNSDFKNHPMFDIPTFDRIYISDDEKYSANCIWMNNYVIVPKGYPKTLKAIQYYGYKTIECDTSEFKKLDGGLSCLSIRF